jgi:DNA repair protein RecO (recombination protein O)
VSQERSEAVVLRQVDFSETSRIVTFLTPCRGRMACIAKGVKRPKSQLAAMLDTFNRLEVVYYWKEGRSVQQLGEVSLLDQHAGIRNDLEKSAYGAFPLEFAYKVAHENEPSEELYAALVQGLEGLSAWPGPARVHVCWQMLRLLEAAGFAPALERCCVTGRVPEDVAGFSYAGGITASPALGDCRLAQRSRQILCALNAARDACPPVEDNPEVFALLGRYTAWQVESSFRSLRVAAQLFDRSDGVHD